MSTDVLSQILETARLLETQLKVYEITIRNAKVVRDANKAKEKQLEKEVLSLRMVLKREQAATRKLTKRCSKYNLSIADSSSWPVQFFNADPLPEFPDFCSMSLPPVDTFANPIFQYQPEPYTDFMFLETGHDTYNPNEPVFSHPSLMDSYIPALHIPPIEEPLLPPLSPAQDSRNILVELHDVNDNGKRCFDNEDVSTQLQPRKKVKFNADGVQIKDSWDYTNGSAFSWKDVVWRTEPTRM